MKDRIVVILSPLFLALSLICLAQGVSAEEYQSLKGVKSARAVFDERQMNPKSAVLHLKLVHQTYKDLASMNKKPDFAVVFSGPSVKLVSKNRPGFSPEDQKSLDELAAVISAMAKDGIKLEICLIAVKVFEIDPDSVLPEIKKVGNGWISLIGFEAQGYSLIPVY